MTSSMSSPATSEALRRRRRDASESLARRMDAAREAQSGITDVQEVILKGVYELERRPDAATRARLAKQVGCTEQAVNAWFRSRRAKAKRLKVRRALCVTLLIVGVIVGAYYAYNASRQTMAARRRREALGDSYKWMTRSGLPRPYADGKNKKRLGARPVRPVEKITVVDATGREHVKQKIYTKDNPKSSPLTRKEETPRQKLERVRAEAAAKKLGKSKISAAGQPNRVRTGTTTADARRRT